MDTTITKTATPTLSRRSKWSPVSRDRKVPGENKVPRENRASRETPGALAPSVPGEWQARRAPGDPKMAKGGFYQNLYNSQFVKVAE